ncbi:MAG: NAD(P)/FAD-dependent oxidoreductase [Eubacteriales bacterium]|nr:NAD(P)/FAD-dependent oxidoreductase [Eubacteriales bacterium]
MSRVLIVGGGAAGMFAAVHAARNGHEVHVYEKNEKLGKKLFITGKGRCNITNACEIEELFDAVLSNPKFLYSSFYSYSNQNVMDFFQELGLKMKVERGNRVFPVSDHSSDVIGTLAKEMKRLGVKVSLNMAVKDILTEDGVFQGIRLADGQVVSGDSCIIATGGISYPSTGSTGDGYRWAKAMGHRICELSPGLVPFAAEEPWIPRLQGLALRNVTAVIMDGNRKCYEEFGEMLFTHYGVSGPIMISASSITGDLLKKNKLKLVIDLKPALSEEQLDQRVLRDFEAAKNRQFKNALGKMFPAKLIPVMVELSGILPEKQVNSISKEERRRFVRLIKNLTVTLVGLRDYNEAIITRGGVSVRDVDPGTMESKRISNLHFAGEVLDLDAVTGGFNLQIAWSTGYMAAQGIR